MKFLCIGCRSSLLGNRAMWQKYISMPCRTPALKDKGDTLFFGYNQGGTARIYAPSLFTQERGFIFAIIYVAIFKIVK